MSDVSAIKPLVKQPAEELTYAMDFANLLDDAEELTSVDLVAIDPAGELALDGDAEISGTQVLMRLVGGADGTTYRVSVRVTTGAGNVREGDGWLKVKD